MSKIAYQNMSRTPLAIILVRIYFAAIAFSLGLFLAACSSVTTRGLIAIGGVMMTAAAALLATFARARASYLYILTTIVVIPLLFAFGIDAFILHGAWWEWVIIFPIQISLPCAWSYYLWKAEPVRQFYLPPK